MLEIALVFAIVVLSSRLDALRDRNFDPERKTRWRQKIVWLGTDPWHLAKWGSFLPPLALCCWFGYGPPWTLFGLAAWVVTIVVSWVVWNADSPWQSYWLRIFRGSRD